MVSCHTMTFSPRFRPFEKESSPISTYSKYVPKKTYISDSTTYNNV